MDGKRIIKIALGQISPALANLKKNIEKHCAFIEQAIDKKADLIVFPELSLTGYSLKDATFDVALSHNDPLLDVFKAYSKQISISCGFVELGTRHELYNTSLFYEEGKLLSRHRKVYLPTYGVFEEDRYFSAGSRFRAFNSKLANLGILVCEDVWHGSSGLILALDGASVILVTANGLTRGSNKDTTPDNINAWETIIKSLAISTTSYVVFVNRVGVEDGLIFWGGSEIVQPNGRTVSKAEYYKEDLHIAEIDMFNLKTSRLNTTLLSDENLPVVIGEFSRIHNKNKEY